MAAIERYISHGESLVCARSGNIASKMAER
jgi:hypothetical protein